MADAIWYKKDIIHKYYRELILNLENNFGLHFRAYDTITNWKAGI